MTDFPTPYGGRNRITLTRKGYVRAFAIVLLVVLFFILMGFEMKRFSNTFNVHRLIFWAIGLGIIIGVLLARKFKKEKADQLETVQMHIFTIVLSIIALPFIISFTNRVLTFHPIQEELVEFVEEDPFISSRFGITDKADIEPEGVHLFFIRNYELERVKARKPVFPTAKKGDKVSLPIRTGLWGFKYFEEQ